MAHRRHEVLSPGTKTLDPGSPREVFGELLEGSLREIGLDASPLAVAYLQELLEQRLHSELPVTPPGENEPSLGESLLQARLEQGATRVRRMRSLGDRALFVAGVFGACLHRSLVGIDYYGQIGSSAYHDLSQQLSQRFGAEAWVGLYSELAASFAGFVDVLAEVGDRTRSEREVDLLRCYDRFVETGSERDRRRLQRQGVLAPHDPAPLRRPQ